MNVDILRHGDTAILWTGDNGDAVREFLGGLERTKCEVYDDQSLHIWTSSGFTLDVPLDDYLCKDKHLNFWTVAGDTVFELSPGRY